MTNFATLNVGKGGAAKLPAIINVFGEMGAHVMALQEIDLNPLSAPGAVNMCRLFGFFLYLGALDALNLHRTAILSCTPGVPVYSFQCRILLALPRWLLSSPWRPRPARFLFMGKPSLG